MGTTNDNQDITSEAPKLLLCSSIASASDPGSNAVTKPQAGIGKEHPELSWYYMYLSYKELKRYIAVFSGRKAVKLRTSEGITEECYFCFKVFSYTEAGHRKRFEQCDYTKQEYAARRESARIVKEAFSTGSASQLNALTDEKEVQGSGWLFVCAPLEQLQRILSAMLPRQYLVTDYVTHRAAVIPQCQMYNPQIQISAESETKRSIFREKDKTKRSKKESAQHSKSRNKSFVMTSVSAL